MISSCALFCRLKSTPSPTLWLVLTEAVMVAGYFVLEWLVLGYGLAAALGAVFPNIVQGISGVIIAAVLIPLIRRVKM